MENRVESLSCRNQQNDKAASYLTLLCFMLTHQICGGQHNLTSASAPIDFVSHSPQRNTIEMASTTSRLRTRLDTLWKAVHNENIFSDQVPEDFLSACKIRLVQHHFETTDDGSDDEPTNLSYDPHILFLPLPQAAIEDHPFDRARCHNPSTGKSKLDFMDYGCPEIIPPRLRSDRHHTRWLSWYLQNWTFPGFPRKHLPPLVWSLADLSYLVPVR